MNIEFKEELENNKMVVCVCLNERLRLNQPRERLHWSKMVEYVKENYTPPKNYTLGACKDLYKVADNNTSQCNVEWEYELIKVKPSPIKVKPSTKKRTVKAKKTVQKNDKSE